MRPPRLPLRNPASRHDPVASEQRRIALMLLVSSGLLIVMSLRWLVVFAVRGAWFLAGLHAATALLGTGTALLVREGRVRLAAYLIVACLFCVVSLIALVLDVPSAAYPRTTHLYLLALGVGASLVLRREPLAVRHGAPLACFAAFFCFATSSGGLPSPYGLPESVRAIGTWINAAGALVALYSLLHIVQSVQLERSALQAQLQKALLRNELQLLYQPQVDEQGRLAGAEALVRWQHPQRGQISPGEFIPVAENSGLILPLGDWVLRHACAQLVAWSTHERLAGLSISVNVSAQQLREDDFVEQVLGVVQRYGIDPARLKLELTESMLADDIEDIVRKMGALKAQGIGFSLDDFGTGFSSLNYLKRLPLAQLKIDQSFVAGVLEDGNDAAIACAVITLGQSLGLDVVAEGVETEAQRQFLSNNGCHIFQGHLFGRPMPAAALEAWLHERQSTASPRPAQVALAL